MTHEHTIILFNNEAIWNFHMLCDNQIIMNMKFVFTQGFFLMRKKNNFFKIIVL